MRKYFIGFTALSAVFMALTASGFSFFSNENSGDLSIVAEGAVGPYSAHSAAYGDRDNSGDSYINLLCLNIGYVKDDTNAFLGKTVAEDRAMTSGTYLGQFNVVNQGFSFCGVKGAVWGYHLAKAQILLDLDRYNELKLKNDDDLTKEESEELDKLAEKTKPLILVKRDDGVDIPVYNGDSIVNAGQKLLGTKANKRFTVLPGAEVKCATKKYISEGPKYIWSTVALCVAEDRQNNANFFIQDAGELAVQNKDEISDFEKKLVKDISHAAVRFGKDNDIHVKEIWISSQIKWIPKDSIGCAVTVVPYVTLAKDAVPQSGAAELVKISVSDWEKALNLSEIPDYNKSGSSFDTEYVNFETKDVVNSAAEGGSSKPVAAKVVDENAWTPLQIGFFKEHYPPVEEYPNIYGVRLGLPITYNDGSCLYGIDLSAFFSATTLVKGLQFTVVGNQAKKIDGLQVSIANFAKEDLNGVQVGGVNYAEDMQGFQFGLVNYANSAQGVQLGVVNYIEDGWLPFTLIFNLKF